MISIDDVKYIREYLGMSHLVLFSIDDEGKQHVSTHGDSESDAKEAAKAGNKLKKSLGWPEDLCNSNPLQRICKNCTFYKADFGYHCFNGWSKDGKDGHCHFEPKKIFKKEDSKCHHFEPNC